MDDEQDAFFGTNEAPEAERKLGLVVPHAARVLTDPATGAIVFDELVALEAAFRAKGRPVLTFEDDALNLAGSPAQSIAARPRELFRPGR
jgi:hypothetical protein